MENARPRIVVLIPAYNESDSIADTVTAMLEQSRPADRVVVLPNGCTDDTAEVARQFPVEVMELPKLAHRKSEALNRGWMEHGYEADIIVCLDADTILPPNALADWEAEFLAHDNFGGSSSKFTAQGSGFLGRLQKSEYSAWADLCLKRGETRVISGTGSALSGAALRTLASWPEREGPWSYRSQTEDFELTYRLRQMGLACYVSPNVRAYTDSMKNLRSLWNQRMKWQVGTVEDLLVFGWNKLTRLDWMVQGAGLVSILVLTLTVLLTGFYIAVGGLTLVWIWLLLPVLIAAVEVKRSLRIPHRDGWDTALALSLAPVLFFTWFRAALFIRAWSDTAVSRITKKSTDRWANQYVAEGV